MYIRIHVNERFCFLATQKSVSEWREKKEQRLKDSDDEEDLEENIYAVVEVRIPNVSF